LGLKRFWKKWEIPPAYAVACQVLIDIAGHEDHSQVFSHVVCADSQLVAMHMGELIGTRGQLKAWRREDNVCEQEIDGSFVLCADFERF